LRKILSQEEAILQCGEWKRNGRRVVFVSGHFALLHPGHIRLLEQARSYGDILLVALSPDSALPYGDALQALAPLSERAEILAALAAIDFVTHYDGTSPAGLIAELSPDIIVEGAELPSHPQAGAFPHGEKKKAAAERHAPEIVHLPLEPGFSTKLLLDRITEPHS